jgi:hypothetical protein
MIAMSLGLADPVLQIGTGFAVGAPVSSRHL